LPFDNAALKHAIDAADSKAQLEDLYLPFRPKWRTKAQIARKRALSRWQRRFSPGPIKAQSSPTSRRSRMRTIWSPNPSGQPGAQGARTPHHLLNGSITPNGLRFVVSWGGAPDIDPDKHRLVIHGLVK
jgi:hypothetical protein